LQQTLVLCFFLLLWPAIGVTTEIMWTFQRRAELQPTTVAACSLEFVADCTHPGQPWPIIVNTFLVYLEGALPYYPKFKFYLKRWQEMLMLASHSQNRPILVLSLHLRSHDAFAGAVFLLLASWCQIMNWKTCCQPMQKIFHGKKWPKFVRYW
jgi:hypothetical protein